MHFNALLRRIAVMALAVAALTLVAAGCGSDNKKSDTAAKGGGSANPSAGKKGGKLTVLWTDDVDFIDPGIAYYQASYQVDTATQKSLMGYKPDDPLNTVPDLAESAPTASADGKTVTVKIKTGVKFSPPVNRVVTSKDVKYAIERGFFNTVNNGYVGAYLADIEGAKVGVDPGTKITGITTPDDQTLVVKLKRATAGTVIGTMTLPVYAPVPEEYAKKFDKKNPSTYGANQIATGPYMIENNAAGKAIGYEAGKRIHLVRNPSWDAKTDYRPAYLDEIDMPQGNDDTTVASRKILTGQSLVNGDFSPPPPILKQAITKQKDQLSIVPSGGNRYVSMNTTLPPFNDINVRKAVIAGFDRNALRLARGGVLIGTMPTHFIPPGIPGYEEAGGAKGSGLDFLNETGQPNAAVSAEYFKKAGMASGKYEGSDEVLVVGTTEGVAQKVAEITKENLDRMGFKVRLRLVTQDSMYTKFCNVPKAKVNVCPNVGWLKDFNDGQTILDPTFNGKNIIPQNNSNWPQLNDPKINAAMDAAETAAPDKRAQAWGDIDKLVTEQAPAVPWVWDNQPNIRSANVNGVIAKWNADWDLSFTSLK